jgi:hypothetical protein
MLAAFNTYRAAGKERSRTNKSLGEPVVAFRPYLDARIPPHPYSNTEFGSTCFSTAVVLRGGLTAYHARWVRIEPIAPIPEHPRISGGVRARIYQGARAGWLRKVSAGLKHAKTKGTRIGRPRRVFDRQRALDMRQQGMSYPQIARALGVG